MSNAYGRCPSSNKSRNTLRTSGENVFYYTHLKNSSNPKTNNSNQMTSTQSDNYEDNYTLKMIHNNYIKDNKKNLSNSRNNYKNNEGNKAQPMYTEYNYLNNNNNNYYNNNYTKNNMNSYNQRNTRDVMMMNNNYKPYDEGNNCNNNIKNNFNNLYQNQNDYNPLYPYVVKNDIQNQSKNNNQYKNNIDFINQYNNNLFNKSSNDNVNKSKGKVKGNSFRESKVVKPVKGQNANSPRQEEKKSDTYVKLYNVEIFKDNEKENKEEQDTSIKINEYLKSLKQKNDKFIIDNKNYFCNQNNMNAIRQFDNYQFQPQNIGDYNNCVGGKNLDIFDIKTDEGVSIILANKKSKQLK